MSVSCASAAAARGGRLLADRAVLAADHRRAHRRHAGQLRLRRRGDARLFRRRPTRRRGTPTSRSPMCRRTPTRPSSAGAVLAALTSNATCCGRSSTPCTTPMSSRAHPARRLRRREAVRDERPHDRTMPGPRLPRGVRLQLRRGARRLGPAGARAGPRCRTTTAVEILRALRRRARRWRRSSTSWRRASTRRPRAIGPTSWRCSTDLAEKRHDRAVTIGAAPRRAPPIGLLAELTHRCPLHCPYCSNPLELERPRGRARHRDLAARLRRGRRARRAAACTSRAASRRRARDLADARRRRRAGRASTPTSSPRASARPSRALDGLAEAGLDHVQLSFQDAERGRRPTASAAIAAAMRKKRAVAREVACGRPAADRQRRRPPRRTSTSVEAHDRPGARARRAAARGRACAVLRLGAGQPRRPDADPRAGRGGDRERRAARGGAARRASSSTTWCPTITRRFPKPCMGGWGRRVAQRHAGGQGAALPRRRDHPGPRVRERARARRCAEIWRAVAGLQRLPRHGLDARALPLLRPREIDFGGCRCQAMALTGDARATDPACVYSPARARVAAAVEEAQGGAADLAYRRYQPAPAA